MPVCRRGIAFFVVFGCSTMGLRRKLVLLGGFSMCLVHGVSSSGSVADSLACARCGPIAYVPTTPLRRANEWSTLPSETTGPSATLHLQGQILHLHGWARGAKDLSSLNGAPRALVKR